MAYTHTNRKIVTFGRDPLDPDSTDWFYFSYQDWKRPDETFVANSALIEGGTIDTDSVLVGTITDSEGVSYTDTFAVQITPSSGVALVTLTHRISTTTGGTPDLGRTNIDHSIKIPVRHL